MMPIVQRLFAAAILMVAGLAQAQTTLLDEVHTVGTAGGAVPVEFSLDITAAGNYEVTLTDLGAPAAALGAVRLAVIKGATLVGTPLTAPGTMTFAATALTTYGIHVTGIRGAGIGSGLFRVEVRNPATAMLVNSYVGIIAPLPGEPDAGQFVLDTAFTVPTTASYDVTLHDLAIPQAVPTLLLAVVEEGGPLITALSTATGNPVSQTATLDSTKQYRVFSIAVPGTPTAGGLYSFDVSAAGGGAAAVRRTVPVGGLSLLGSINLAAGPHTLALRDLAFPAALSAAVANVVNSGQLVAQAAGAGDVAFVAMAGPHEVYGFGAVAPSALAGSVNVTITPDGQPAVFNAAHVFAPSGGASVFTYEVAIANAANFRVRLADYQFPAAFQTLRLAAVQNGAVTGTPLTAPGSFDVAAAQGKLTLLAVAQGAAGGSLFGADVTPIALGAVAFETTQGVGGSFVARKLTVNGTASYDVTVADLGFPAGFANLSTAVTRGSDRIGLIFGGGTFAFNATPGNYFLNLIAMPAASQSAGTYAVSVTERPPPPVVTLTAAPERISSTGGPIDLTWSTQGATSCTASGGWSGTKAVSGTERSATITTATTFTLACTGAGGTTTQAATVDVIPGSNTPKGGGGAFEMVWLLLLGVCVAASLALRRAQPPMLLVVIASMLVLSGCGGAQSRYARSMERGAAFLEDGDLEKARVEFRNAMQISPQSAEARYETGMVAQRRGDFREALLSFKSAVDIKPDYPEARAALAGLFILAGAPDRAMEMLNPGLAKHPDHAGLLVARGAAYMQLKKPNEARADAERAMQLDPASETAAALLSSMMRNAHESERAVALLEATLKRAPRSVDLRRILATLKIEAGDMASAEAALKETVRIQPRELSLRYELANFYLRSQNLDAAQKTLEAAVAAVPTNDDAKLILANFLATQRSREAGEATLRALIAKDPDNLDLRLGLGALFERNGADPQAIAAYGEIIKRDPEAPKALVARNRLAAYYASHGDVPRAEQLIAQIVKSNPHDLDALALRARLEIDAGKPADAVVDLRTVLREMPNSSEAYRMLARANLANGEAALAEDALRKSLELAPADSAARVELAQLLTRTGRADAAVSMLEDAVRRNPTDATVREALVRVYVETRDLVAAARSAEDIQLLLPHRPMGFYLRGQVAQLQKDPAEAEKQFELALAVEPRAIDSLAALSRLQVAGGRGNEAIARVEAMLTKGDDAAVLRNLLGELLLATNQPDRAVPVFEKTIAQSPKWWLPYRNLAIAKYTLKDAAGATRTYEAGVKQIPDEVLLVVDLAALYELQNRIDDAVRTYENFHAGHPRHDLATNNLAKLLLAHGNDPKSLARAVELTAPFANANDPALLDTYGWTLYRQGKYQQAQQVLEAAFQRAQDSGSIRYHLALVQVQAGQLKKAIENLEIAVMSPRGFVGIAGARSLLVDLKARAS